MTWNIAAARKRIGLPDADTSRDPDLTACMDAALGLAEKYCDRRFLFVAGDVLAIFNATSADVHVYRWPIKQVVSVTSPQADGSFTDLPYVVDKDQGVVYLGSGAGAWRACSRDVVVTFDGGYEVDKLPADLEYALWAIFDVLWAGTPGWGLPGGPANDTGAVRSFTIDGMSISYEASTGQSSGGGGATAWGSMPARSVASLDFYRAETAVGGA